MQWIVLVTALINLVLSAFAIFKIPKRYFLKNAFVIFTLITSVWLFANYFILYLNDFQWRKIGYALGALMIACGCVVVESFSQQKKLGLVTHSVFCIVGIIFSALCVVDGVFFRYNPGALHHIEMTGLFLIYTLYFFTAILFIIFRILTARRKFHGILKKQATLIFVGILLFGLMSFSVSFLMPLFGYNHLIDMDTAFSLFFVVFIAYAIFRYQVMDISVVVRRSSLYALVIFVMTVIYMTAIFAFEFFFRSVLKTGQMIPRILASVVFAILFAPVRNAVEKAISRIFYPGQYQFQKAIREFSSGLVRVIDPSELVDIVNRKIVEMMQIDKSVVHLLDEGGKFRCAASWGVESGVESRFVSWDHDFINDLNSRDYISLQGVSDAENEPFRKAVAGLKASQIAFVLPVRMNEEMIGFFMLGEKQNGDLYSSDDVDLLRTVSNEFAIALSNARSYRKTLEKEKTDRDLEIAAQIQKLFMPAVIEQPKGLEITAHYAPAMAIGGDYYDVIRIDDNRALIVLMDISGHGSSAAIVLSMISSYFHSNACRFENPGNLLTDLNREMIRRLKGQKYATGIVLDWDSVSRTVSWANAGHPEFLRLDEEGRLLPVEKGADPPVGVLEDQVFQTRRLKLGAGEKMVLMTDGVYEAMNPREEMLGMEAVSARITELGRGLPQELIRGLVELVEDFRGKTPQGDDIAVMVISMNRN